MCGSAGHGPAVVMLHGFGTTGDMWGSSGERTHRRPHDCRARLRGLGLSSKPDGGYDKKNQAADVVGVLDAMGVRTAELVTHDIGIMVGFAVGRHPPRAREPMGGDRCAAARRRTLGSDHAGSGHVALWLR